MNDPDQRLVGLRGATTCHDNTAQAIETATAALIDALVERNSLLPEQIVSLTFSVTADLNACFPAAVARRREGWHSVALLDCQQMAVVGDLPRCIRLLAHVWLPMDRAPTHPYLEEARFLRPDRLSHN
ncbi:chorismate mutase [Synechococcus sp. MIT S1220]|uniref:chorismate mutase n=1 Tax=Synechococcus sp. MIT S1220 TaxID=3082549 RepID=UPI0039AF2076